MSSERSKSRKIAEVVSSLFEDSATLGILNHDVNSSTSNVFYDFASFHDIRNEIDSNLESNELLTNSNYCDNSSSVIETEISEIKYNEHNVVSLNDDSYE